MLKLLIADNAGDKNGKLQKWLYEKSGKDILQKQPNSLNGH
jgi:hypothetical protein